MKKIILIIFLALFLMIDKAYSQIIWTETFDIAEKGYWGGGSDMSGITKWTIDESACTFADINDYIKTVATGDSRLEAMDINGEAIWRSEIIDISSYSNVELSVLAAEVGSSNDLNKYVKLYYIIDSGIETLFETNGENINSWTSALAEQKGLNGSTLQIVVRMNTTYASDKCYIDNVTVSYDNIAPEVTSLISTSSTTIKVEFSEQVNQTTAETLSNYSIDGIGNPTTAILQPDLITVELVFPLEFTDNQLYTFNISGVEDINSNAIVATNFNFTYTPFALNDIYVISSNEIICEFSNNLDVTSAAIFANYTVDNAIGNPISAVLQTDKKYVKLTFAGSFINNTEYNLNIENLEDENNMVISSTNMNFAFHQVIEYDIVINEIMADPSPTFALPEYEYFELFNNTNYDISLYNWKVRIGTSDKIIPFKKIPANGYIIVCSSTAESALSVYSNTIGILGSIDLTNAGKEISILNNFDLLIDYLSYSDSWYQNTSKDDGGWSLEKIDPNNNCSTLGNWIASESITGGTPGQQNSVFAENIDNQAPEIENISITSANTLTVTFSENINETDASVLSNYLVDNAINPISAFVDAENKNIVYLSFTADFSEGAHNIKIYNIRDICDNAITEISTNFSYYSGNEFDILINEIMLDISPAPNVLPASKYIELYNNTDLDIDLNGWQLAINDNSAKVFSNATIKAKDYIILCEADNLETFQNYGNSSSILTESQLTISGGQISLFNAIGKLIDYVKYSDTWYADSEKENGGWSLERIDYTNYCGQSQNWKASEDYKGGTPAAINSLSGTNIDNADFEITNITVLSSYKISVSFSKNIKETEALTIENYSVSDGLGNPLIVNFSDTSRATVILQFATQFIDANEHIITINNIKDFCDNSLSINQFSFVYYLIYPKAVYAETENLLHVIFSEEVEIISAQLTENYTMSDSYGNPFKAYKHSEKTNEVYLEYQSDFINATNYSLHIENVKDLNGNSIIPADLDFSFYVPSSNDIVINEILFNPKTDGDDFVEIYNKSAYIIDLKNVKIATRDELGNFESIYNISQSNNLFRPSEIMAITKDSTKLKTYYPAASYERFVQVSSMPSFNDDKGEVVILFNDIVLDDFSYIDDMHFALISDKEGVSLERVSPLVPTADLSNWQSAAENVGFASPANINSHYVQFSDNENDEIKLEPEVFSPNNDGYDDKVFIRYNFKESGYVANVSIYNAKGRLIKRIAKNELLASQGSFSWNGLSENESISAIGIYMVYFEVFNLQGVVKKYKKTCVLAAKLN